MFLNAGYLYEFYFQFQGGGNGIKLLPSKGHIIYICNPSNGSNGVRAVLARPSNIANNTSQPPVRF